MAVKTRASSSERRPMAAAVRDIRWHLAALALLAVLIPVDGSWAVQLLLIPVLLVVPGLILLRALRVPGRAVASFPAYVPCASVTVLLGSGLVVDLLGLLIGASAPLRPGPLLAGVEVICLALLAASVNAPADVAIPWDFSQPAATLWPVALPLVAAAGALRLNSGHGDSVALLAAVLCLGLLIWGVGIAPRLRPAQLAVILYAAGLAMMWSFSLRGNLVYGFDIATEYHVMDQTIRTGVWHPSHPGDAYSALLSISVLPAELHALTGMPGLLVYKVVYPAIGALFPVAVFGLARRALDRRWAFAAAAFVLMQTTFFATLTALARQEISLALFAGLVAMMLDTRLPFRPRMGLVVLFALAMAVSHYSTTYLAVGVFGLAATMQFVISWMRRVARISWPVAGALLTALLGGLLWYGPVTHSSSNLSNFVHTTQTQGLDVLPGARNGNLLSAYLQAGLTPPLTPAQYQQDSHQFYAAHQPSVIPLPVAASPQYALSAAPPTPSPPVIWQSGYNLLGLGGLLITQLTNLLAALGAVLMVLWRKIPVVARQVGLLSFGALAILTVIRFSGTLAQAYNPERALLQTLLILSVGICWPLQGLAGRDHASRWGRRRRAGVITLAATAMVVLFVNSSGLLGAVLGGGTSANLANSGFDYEHFVMTTPELAAASWVSRAAGPNQLLYADRYAELRLYAVEGQARALIPDITPLTLGQHAWVYASRSNVDGQATSYFNGQTVSYAFPSRFLNANFDMVYTDGSSEVFHR